MPHAVSCGACHATLKIPDKVWDKRVQGQVATIKCRRCSAPIEIDGRESTPSQATSPARLPDVQSGAEAAKPPLDRAVTTPSGAAEAAKPPSGKTKEAAKPSEAAGSAKPPSEKAKTAAKPPDAGEAEEPPPEKTRVSRPAEVTEEAKPPARKAKAAGTPPAAAGVAKPRAEKVEAAPDLSGADEVAKSSPGAKAAMPPVAEAKSVGERTGAEDPEQAAPPAPPPGETEGRAARVSGPAGVLGTSKPPRASATTREANERASIPRQAEAARARSKVTRPEPSPPLPRAKRARPQLVEPVRPKEREPEKEARRRPPPKPPPKPLRAAGSPEPPPTEGKAVAAPPEPLDAPSAPVLQVVPPRKRRWVQAPALEPVPEAEPAARTTAEQSVEAPRGKPPGPDPEALTAARRRLAEAGTGKEPQKQRAPARAEARADRVAAAERAVRDLAPVEAAAGRSNASYVAGAFGAVVVALVLLLAWLAGSSMAACPEMPSRGSKATDVPPPFPATSGRHGPEHLSPLV